MDKPKAEFNNEIAWGDNRGLFKKYFEGVILKDKHGLSTIEQIKIHDDFDANVAQLKNQYINR
jgi:hypothetical protein